MSYNDEPQAGGLISARIFNILFLIGMMVLAFFIVKFILFNMSPTRLYQNQCEGLGGTYWETQNVDCKTFYTYCFANCNLNNKTYNFYDGDLCVLDCKDFNEKSKDGVTCLC